jgi:uncharacterized protein YggE
MLLRSTTFATAALGLALALGAASAASADEQPPRRTMTVTGAGEIAARPDIAYIDTGVTTEAATAAKALDANTKAMAAIFKGLEGMKIDKDDIRTSQFSVNPVYAQPPVRPDGTQEPAKIRGYQVTNQVTVAIRKLDGLGAALDELVSLGSNQVGGINFAIDNPDPLQDKAREAAVADALRKAKLYAGAAGVALGPIITISESGGYAPQPIYAMKAMAMRDAAPVPVAAGTQKVTSDVTLVIGVE